MLEDRQTLDRFRAGDRATLAEVYRAHAPEVARLVARGFGFRSGGEVHRFFGYRAPHEQQDAVQEVFTRAFAERGRLSYDGLTPYRAYLRGILKNLVIDDFRKKRAALETFRSGGDDGDEGDDLIDQLEAPSDAPEVTLQRRALTDAMQGFVDSLPEREQRFVALRYTEGLPQEEVARRLRVGRSTVRTLEERVRARLHTRLRTRGLLEEQPRRGIGGFLAKLVPAFVFVLITVGGLHG